MGRAWIVFIILTLLLPLPSVAQGNPPTETDLRAAYCLPIVSKNVAMLPQDTSDFPEGMRAETDAFIAELQSNKQRLVSYLEPRLKYLDSAGMRAAMRRGEEDYLSVEQSRKKCSAEYKSYGLKRVDTCLSENPATMRYRNCNNLDFLPF